ncbi:N-acetyltransferase family protein [Haladaptatus sp. NG-SE-30]
MGSNACGFWRNDGCEGTPHCPPRCPRFVGKYGTPYLILPLGEDLDALVSMYLEFDPQYRSLGLPPKEEKEIVVWLERLHERGTNLVAWDDERIVGHAGYAPNDGDVPEFVVYVHQDYHGRGLGTELTKHAVAHAGAAGHDGLKLDVDGKNEPAVAIYRALGFEVVKRHAMELEMVLSFEDPVVEQVSLAPAIRP